jgi:hypothetical protein
MVDIKGVEPLSLKHYHNQPTCVYILILLRIIILNIKTNYPKDLQNTQLTTQIKLLI